MILRLVLRRISPGPKTWFYPRLKPSRPKGPFLTFVDGKTFPGTDGSCRDFEINGPFISIHAFTGSSDINGFSAT